jgi:hypothetical protein
MDKQREKQIKIFIWVFSSVIFIGGLALLLNLGLIHFSWLDNWVAQREYNQGKQVEKRILVLGDSHLEYMPIDGCLGKEMRKYCKEKNIGFVNLAHHGFGPIEYYDQLVKVAPDFKPTLIIQFYYAGNDLTDILYRNDYTPMARSYEVAFVEDENNQGALLDSSDSKPEISEQRKVEVLNSHSFDWALFEEKGVDPEMIEFAKNRLYHPEKIGPEYVNPHLLVLGTWQPDFLFHNLKIEAPRARAAWFRVMEYYEKMLRVAEEYDADFYLVVIPQTVQVDTSHFELYRKLTFNVSNELTRLNRPQQLMAEFAEASKIHYLDLLPYFKNNQSNENLYFENDNHFSYAGHKLAFELVKQNILQPFSEGKLKKDMRWRERNYYKNFKDWLVKDKVQLIESDTAWMTLIENKAKENKVSVEQSLFEDAEYLVNQEIKKNE